ncbi:MAG: RluA family pseudouridine synthase [Planctomycetota bacterium]|nr:RluA family pseudouridine synthase [Planctomycetota bacterium]
MNPSPLTIIDRGPDWAVIDKPAGLLSVPGKGDEPAKRDCVPARLRLMIPDALGPLVVHRLDMDTSGLLVLGLTPHAQRALSAQFEARTVSKRYIALVDGVPTRDAGEIRLPIRPDIDNRPWQIVDGLRGRDSITRWQLLAIEVDRARLSMQPLTGRAHQLRLHAAVSHAQGGLGCCIVGDVLYGSNYRGPAPDDRGTLAPAPRLMLHAAELSFDDPTTGRRITCSSPAPF